MFGPTKADAAASGKCHIWKVVIVSVYWRLVSLQHFDVVLWLARAVFQMSPDVSKAAQRAPILVDVRLCVGAGTMYDTVPPIKYSSFNFLHGASPESLAQRSVSSVVRTLS